MNMKFGSVCSGIEAASMAWLPIGWEASWLAEIEPFPAEVLKHHYPDTPNYGDMTLLPEMVLRGEIEAPDVLVGGTPCQSFSVAGMREGLSDERGQLTIKYVELANAIDNVRRRDEKDECIIVWENVPGILNSKDNAFGCFIAALAGGSSEARAPGGGRWANAGYVLGPERAVAWRVLDAQYFGLAQRRKRVFVVASAREDICPAEILFEFDDVRRDIAPSREQGEEAASNVRTGFTPSSFGGYRAGVGTLRANGGDLGGGSETLVTQGFRKLTFESYAQDETASTIMARDYKSYTDLVAFNSRQDPVSGDVFGTLDASSPQAQAIAIQGSVIGRKQENGPQGSGYDETGVCFTQTSVDRHAVATVYPINTMTMLGRPSDDLKPRMGLGIGKENDPQNTLSAAHCHAVAITQVAGTLTTGFGSRGVVMCQIANGNCAITPTVVRRLTPVECERLQGFPDGYTAIPWRGKPADECPDGHRYKALGNSMAVPVMRWIGERINAFLP